MANTRKKAINDLYEILNFVRVDGPIDAPIVLLTIEDGGNHTETSSEDLLRSFKTMAKPFLTSKNDGHIDLCQYIQSASAVQKKPMAFGGRIGINAMKIIDYTLNNHINTLRSSAHQPLLYSNNSPIVNIKSCPIAKPTVANWSRLSKMFHGLEMWEYNQIAASVTTRIHHKLIKYLVERNSKIIVAGKFPYWAPVLLTCMLDKNRSYLRYEKKGRCEIFFDTSGKTMFCNWPLIRGHVTEGELRFLTQKGFL